MSYTVHALWIAMLSVIIGYIVSMQSYRENTLMFALGKLLSLLGIVVIVAVAVIIIARDVL